MENNIGKIISIEDNIINIELEEDKSLYDGILNKHVAFVSDENKLIGEVVGIKENVANVLIVGQMEGANFISGAIKKPKLTSGIRILNEQELEILMGTVKGMESLYFNLGTAGVYDNYPVNVKYNDFLNGHFAIFGNSGAGKSCGVTRIIQNIFSKTNPVPYKTNLFIFDVYGEYNTAFENINKLYPNINCKIYSTNVNQSNHPLINIPFWLLGLDDIALLLGATEPTQLPILSKALRLVKIFCSSDDIVIKYKNDIIARAIEQILYSGRPASQIRDQILAVLSTFNTSELNVDTKIVQPGYTRTLKQCLIIDSSGKINEIGLVMDFIKTFIDDTLEYRPADNIIYNLEDFKEALDFALINEGILKSDKVYDLTNLLVVRLQSLIDSSESKFFYGDKYINKEEYIKDLLTTYDGKKAQIINFNINYVDDRMAKCLVKIISKMVFDFCTKLKYRASFPFHLLIEEAHRYIQNDNDVYLLGYNIFERIAKEGRKYGVILGLISQRPSEISETTLSQCTNFLIFRLVHPKDLGYVEDMVPNITSDISKKLKTLQPGNCIGFGSSFRIPVIIKFKLPDPMPQSTNCDILKTWFVQI